MARGYAIRASLNRSFWDHEITLPAAGFQMKPLPLKVILFWVGSLFFIFWVVTNTPVQKANYFLLGLIVVLWVILTGFFAQTTDTKELKARLLPVAVNYAKKENREVLTRQSSHPYEFYAIVGIKDLDMQTGLISYQDGTFGQMYLVVGTASRFLFESDETAILNRYNAFWKKVDTDCEFCTITTFEPQRVYRQVAALEERNKNLQNRDADLRRLLKEEYEILVKSVGGSFTSIHQYLLLKGDNMDALRGGHTVVASEAENSSLIFKQCVMLDGKDTLEALKTIYSGRV